MTTTDLTTTDRKVKTPADRAVETLGVAVRRFIRLTERTLAAREAVRTIEDAKLESLNRLRYLLENPDLAPEVRDATTESLGLTTTQHLRGSTEVAE